MLSLISITILSLAASALSAPTEDKQCPFSICVDGIDDCGMANISSFFPEPTLLIIGIG